MSLQAPQNYINVAAYGAEHDVPEDQSEAIQAAWVDALAANKGLYFPAGTYVVHAHLNWVGATSSHHLRVLGESPGVTLDLRGSGAAGGLSLGGSCTFIGPYLQYDVMAGDTFIPGPDVTADVGDLLLLSTEGREEWAPGFPRGEFVMVREVTESGPNRRLHLTRPLRESYAAATTKVFRVESPKVSVRGVRVLRDGNVDGIAVRYARDVVMRNCITTGARDHGIVLQYCYRGSVARNVVLDAYAAPAESLAMFVSSCAFVRVHRNRLYSGKRAYTEGGAEPNEGCTFLHNHAESYDTGVAGTAAVWYQANCVAARAAYNGVVGGLNADAPNITVDHNQIRARSSSALFFTPIQACDYIYAQKNVLYADAGGSNVALWYAPADDGVHVGRLAFDGNHTYGGLYGIEVTASPGRAATIASLQLDDNFTEDNSGYAANIHGDLSVSSFTNTGRGSYTNGVNYAPGS